MATKSAKRARPANPDSAVTAALDIAADICVYTNRNVTVETLKA